MRYHWGTFDRFVQIYKHFLDISRNECTIEYTGAMYIMKTE